MICPGGRPAFGEAVELGSLTIANGATDSDVLASSDLKGCRALGVQAPAVLTGTVTVKLRAASTGSTFASLNDPPGTAVTLVGGDYVGFVVPPFMQLQLVSDGAEGDDREFLVCGWRG